MQPEHGRVIRHRLEDAVRQIEEIEGLSEAYVLVSQEEGQALTMTLWDSQYAMEGSRDTAARLRREAAKETEGSVVSVAEYEVALHEVAGGAA
jgi:heme-degrading monooxygenase HmoA